MRHAHARLSHTLDLLDDHERASTLVRVGLTVTEAQDLIDEYDHLVGEFDKAVLMTAAAVDTDEFRERVAAHVIALRSAAQKARP